MQAGVPSRQAGQSWAAQPCCATQAQPLLVLMRHPVGQPQIAAILRGLHASPQPSGYAECTAHLAKHMFLVTRALNAAYLCGPAVH